MQETHIHHALTHQKPSLLCWENSSFKSKTEEVKAVPTFFSPWINFLVLKKDLITNVIKNMLSSRCIQGVLSAYSWFAG